MKYMKIFIGLFIIFFISGCSINYTLEISDNYFTENISVTIDDSDVNNVKILKNYNPVHYNDDIVYEKNVKKRNGKTTVNLRYRYTLEQFQSANSVNQGFYNRSIKEVDDIIYINLTDFEGFAAEVDFDIRIKTDNEVLKNNADSVKGNTYIWHVDKNNKKNLSIEMQIKKGTKKTFKDKYNYISYIIVGIALLSVIVAIIILIKKNKNSKKI